MSGIFFKVSEKKYIDLKLVLQTHEFFLSAFEAKKANKVHGYYLIISEALNVKLGVNTRVY